MGPDPFQLLTTPVGFEPTLSDVTGRRFKPLSYEAKMGEELRVLPRLFLQGLMSGPSPTPQSLKTGIEPALQLSVKSGASTTLLKWSRYHQSRPPAYRRLCRISYLNSLYEGSMDFFYIH